MHRYLVGLTSSEVFMSNTDFDPRRGPRGGQPRGKAGLDEKGFSPARLETAPGRDAKSSSHAAPSWGDQLKTLVSDQVGSGADVVAQFATATRKAADELDSGAPRAAHFVNGLAQRLDSYAEVLRDRSIDELVSSASDYTRRNPALVFGVAALAGFVVMRTFKNASTGQQRGMDQGHPGARKGQSNVY